jgi:hypothetical protein
MAESQPGPGGGAAPGPTSFSPPPLAFVHRLQFRLSILVLIAAIPLAAVLAWAGLHGRDEAMASAGDEVARLARVAARVQEQEFDEAFRLLDALAADPVLVGGTDAERAKVLVAALPRSPSAADLHLLKPDGSVVAAALPAEAARSLLSADTAARATKSALPSIGGFRAGGNAGPTVHLARPMPAGTAGGPLVIGAIVRLEVLGGFQRTLQLPEGAVLDILDPEAKVVLRLGGNADAIGKTHPAPALFREPAVAGGAPPAGVDVDGVRRLFGQQALAPGASRQGLLVVVSTPEEVILGPAQKRLTAYLAGSGIVLVVALVLARIFGERFVLRRVNGIVLATKRVAATDLRQFKARTRVSQDPSELGDLERAFDEMATALETRVREIEDGAR